MKALFCRALILVCLCSLISLRPVLAQYTDPAVINDLGGPQEFARRRQELAKQMKQGILVLFARTQEPESSHYREDNDFFYFTGVADPGAVMVMNASDAKTTIFEPAQSPRIKQVYGPNLLSLSPDERQKFGYSVVMPVTDLDTFLTFMLSRGSELWLRMGFADKADGARPEVGRDYAAEYAHPYGEFLPGDRSALKKLAERYPSAHQNDATPLIDAMRNIKTASEITVLRRNGKLSAEGIRQAIAHAHPGMFEYQIEAQADFVFRNGGAQGWAYPAIVSSGDKVNTWHYFSDRQQIPSGTLVVFDFAADLDHETMDITRTFNISGKFPPEQAKWYQADLEAQKATIALLRPGHTYEEAAAAGKAVYEKNGIGNQWSETFPFPGHFVGLATHDVLRPQGPVKAGQVVTVEPIIEFPEKHLHFRVEDTVLITEGDPEILSSGVPKEMADVEKLVGSAK
ncbi:MAG TPA: Xaa-Pro peptidase family protein [Terriglobales bacterium]|nr:Xaa-Pro peptidase family protein [Terriglobales bacterium]